MSKDTVTIGDNKVTVDNDWGFNAKDVKGEAVVLFWQGVLLQVLSS